MASPAAENGTSGEFKEIPLSSSIPGPPVAKKKDNRIWFLYGIIGALVLAVIVLAVCAGILFFTSRSHQDTGNHKNDVNYSPGQIRAAYRLQSSMNLSVDPCEDFHEYVCGKWLAEAEISPIGITSPFTEGQDVIVKRTDTLLRSAERSSSAAIEKVKSFYKACVDEEKISQQAIEKARDAIKSLGDFPILDGTVSNNFTWAEHVLSLAKKGQQVKILNLRVHRDQKNQTRNIILFGSGFPPWSIKDDENEMNWMDKAADPKEAYRNRTKLFLQMFAEDANLQLNNSNLDKDLDELADFYLQWVKLLFKPETASSHNFWGVSKPWTIEEAPKEEKFSTVVTRFEQKTGLNLRVLLMAMAPEFAHGFLSDENLYVQGSSPRLEDALAQLIRETSPNTWKNFYQLQVLVSYRGHFPEKYLPKIQKKQPQWRECWDRAQREFGYAFDAVYVRDHSGQEKKKAVVELVKNLKESFAEIIRETDWLDAETKKNALIKLEKQLVQIGYHDTVLDDEKLDAIYKDLKIDGNMSYLDMLQELQRWNTNKDWQSTIKPVDRDQFRMPATKLNAKFSASSNTITFPLAILKEPFFDLDAPKALNYGGIGAVIGHEITHGFDSRGRKYDEIGNLRNWWTNSSNENFERKAKLMVEQYDNYELKEIEMNVNGTLTLGENIADNGAIKESLRAYKKYLERNGREAPLPGLNFTSEQLFYIGWTRNWCSKASPQYLITLLLTNTHSPDKARTNVVVSNQPEFAKAFNCPAGSPMNPVKKVDVW